MRAWAYQYLIVAMFPATVLPCDIYHCLDNTWAQFRRQHMSVSVSHEQFGYFHPGFLWREARWSVWSQTMPCHWRSGTQNSLCPLFVAQIQAKSLQLNHKKSDNGGTLWLSSPQEEKFGRQHITWTNAVCIGIVLRVFKMRFSRMWWSSWKT